VVKPNEAVAFIVVMAAIGAPASAAPSVCAIDRGAQLAKPADDFDQQKGGWRAIAGDGHDIACDRAAAALIALYVRSHRKSLALADLKSLQWHAGQMWAYAGDYPHAVRSFVASNRLLAASLGGKPDDIDRGDYEKATIAFVRRDRANLLAAQARMHALPEPSWYAEAGKRFTAKFGGPAPAWPPDGGDVDRLVTCFDAPYAQAYEGTCPAARKGGPA
jgi:hypothetical protein